MKQLLTKALIILSAILSIGEGQASNPVEITINCNGIHLKGKFYVSEETGNCPTVILLQGFPGNEQDVLGIGKKLSEAGMNALTFNYSGTHQSQGELNFDNTQKDIKAVMEFIHQSENIHHFKIDTTRIYLGGYSYGGGMAFTYAANHPDIRSVFSISGTDHGVFLRMYDHNPEMREIVDKMFDDLKDKPKIVRFGPGLIPKEAVEMGIIDINPTYDLIYCAPLLAPKNIMLIGGWDDPQVTMENFVLPLYRALIKAQAKNVKITAVQDNHSFSNTRKELAEIVIDWLKSINI
jgi:uncharacterized protein